MSPDRIWLLFGRTTPRAGRPRRPVAGFMLHSSIDGSLLDAELAPILLCNAAIRISAMAKTSVAPFPAPEPKLPKIDLGALFGAQRANLATAHEAEIVLL